MLILRSQFHYLQNAGSAITRPVPAYYNFFHFPTPVEMEIDGERFMTRPNACVFFAPMQPRGFYFSEDTTMNWIHAFPEIKPLLEKYGIPLNTVFYPRNTGFISDLFRKMKMEILQQEPHYQDIVDGYAMEFLVTLSRSIAGISASNLSSADVNKLYRLRAKILSEADKKWTVEEMAQMASLSPSRFHAVYKSLFGSPPMKDLIGAKIDYAKTLLLMEDKPVLSCVAERLGYKSQQHFISQFKSVTGMTPGAYRKHNR